MKIQEKKQLFLIATLLLAGISYLYYYNQPICQSCGHNNIEIKKKCMPVRSTYTVYRQLNCFCDKDVDWKHLSLIINELAYYRNIYKKIYPDNIIGIKTISCVNDELQWDVFEDKDCFIFIEQDTSQVIYKGALKRMCLSDGHKINYKMESANIERGDKEITILKDKAIIKYFLEYDQINLESLSFFQKVVNYDSIYRKKYDEVDYQMINKKSSKKEASILYEDKGIRFYFRVF